MQQERASRTGQVTELANVRRKIAQIVDAIADSMYQPSMKAKLNELEARRTELEALVGDAGRTSRSACILASATSTGRRCANSPPR